jgi:hypothetical protein
MKLCEIKSKTLSFELPSPQEISAAKQKFQNDIKKHRLFHATTERAAKKIQNVGFKAMTYFTVGEPGWDEDIILTVPGKDFANDIYPDPEHLIDSDKFMELFDPGSGLISFKTVTKKLDKDILFWFFYELHKQENWDGNPEGLWVICLAAISPDHIEEE